MCSWIFSVSCCIFISMLLNLCIKLHDADVGWLGLLIESWWVHLNFEFLNFSFESHWALAPTYCAKGEMCLLLFEGKANLLACKMPYMWCVSVSKQRPKWLFAVSLLMICMPEVAIWLPHVFLKLHVFFGKWVFWYHKLVV